MKDIDCVQEPQNASKEQKIDLPAKEKESKKEQKEIKPKEKTTLKDNDNTLFIRNIPFEFPLEEFKQKMQAVGKVMYVNYVQKEGLFKGNAFVRFVNKEDTEKLLSLFGEIQSCPEKRSVLDSKQTLQIGTHFLEVMRFKKIDQEQ